MCDVLEVSSSGYYDWINSSPSKRSTENVKLDKEIKEVFMKNKKRYGSPRITKCLNYKNIKCSPGRVARRMQKMGLQAVAKKKFKVTTDSNHTNSVFRNILNRDFSTTDINQKWAGDITYIRTKEGWLYLSVIIDLHSRAVIGWSMSKNMNKDLICNALIMALYKRKFPKGVIVHTDRGSQYSSNKYKKLLLQNNLIGSMSRKGNCWDNAIAESFFSYFKSRINT